VNFLLAVDFFSFWNDEGRKLAPRQTWKYLFEPTSEYYGVGATFPTLLFENLFISEESCYLKVCEDWECRMVRDGGIGEQYAIFCMFLC
jgi:hypothetical protein